MTSDLLASLVGDDESAALAMVERLDRVVDEQYSNDVGAAVAALVTALATARSPRVRAACAVAVAKLLCWSDSPAGPINLDEARLVLSALCQAIRRERERDVRLAVIDALAKQAHYRSGRAPDGVDELLLECVASDDIVEHRAAQCAILGRVFDGEDAPAEEAIVRTSFAKDRNEFARFIETASASAEQDWARLLIVGETTMGWVEDSIGPPDDPPYAVLRSASPSPSIWKYDLGDPAKRLFVFRFDPMNRWRLSFSGYEQ